MSNNENEVISMRKLEYLKKTLNEVTSKPYKINIPLISNILENFSTVSYLKIHELHSMTLDVGIKPIEESQITFIKNTYEKEK